MSFEVVIGLVRLYIYSSRKKKAVVFTTVTMSAYQDQINAGFSKVCEIVKCLQHRIFNIRPRI